MQYIGKPLSRIDAENKVKGNALYPGDYNLKNQAYLKVLFSKHPHAIVTSIETSTALSFPGVIAVLTAKDVPTNEYGMIIYDQPVLCGPGSTIQYANRSRCVGDQIAIVIAETEKIAEKARDLIHVDYEPLSSFFDPEDGMKEGAPLIHPETDTNVFCHYKIRKGDVQKAFNRADIIVEGTYRTPVQEHVYLQPEAGVSYVDEEGRVTVITAGQSTHGDQDQIAHTLNLPVDKVRVIYPAIGGAFGGREDVSVQIILALASWHLSEKGINRPVKIMWSREESIIGHHKRHPFTVKTKWGAKKDGKIIAAEVSLIADGGAYIYSSTKVIQNATLTCTGPYEIPNVKVDSYGVYTNNIPNGAFRGFGGPQGAFIAETQINKLAEALSMDPVKIRKINLIKEGRLLPVGSPLPKGVSIGKVVDECAKVSNWYNSRNEKRGIHNYTTNLNIKKGKGFACAFKNVGYSFGHPDHCSVKIELHGESEIEQAILYHAGAEVGQGVHTVISQMAAEALGLPIEKIQLVTSDTASCEYAGSVSASRMTFMAGNAINGAASLAMEKWRNEERPVIVTYEYRAPKTTPLDPQTGASNPNFAYGYVAQVVEVEVDVETGTIHIPVVYCADDVGCAINPTLAEGQVEGAIVQAAGYGIMENYIQRNGEVITKNYSTYLIPTAIDVPEEIQSVLLEYPDPIGPFGARGLGEMPFLPFVPALIAAVHNATGVWFNEFPLTPERVLFGLNKSTSE